MKVAWSRKNLWERTPGVVKSAVGAALRCIPPAWLLGRSFRRQMAFVQAAQWWSAERARGYQLARLQQVLRTAYDRSPAYRALFQSVGFEPGDLKSLDDLCELPTIDKDFIRENFERLCVVWPGSPGVDYVSTGGTSGRLLNFYINADRSAVEYAHLLSGWMRIGYRADTAQAVFRGLVIDAQRDGLRHAYDPILRRHSYSNFHMTEENMARYLRHAEGIGPFYLHGYPSAVSALTRFILRSGHPVPRNVRGILAGSENVYEEERAQAEEVWGVRYYSWYGHSEKLVLGAECEHSTDYHVWPTYGLFELIDEEGRIVSEPGRSGEIVGTGFINRVMPFIRYRTGDFATYVGEKCDACGREHPLIRGVRGHRTQEMMVSADGALISWTALNLHDDTFHHVRQFQFCQEKAGEAVLWVVPGEGFGDADLKRIHRGLNHKLAGRIVFRVERCEHIELTRSGKSTFVDQRIDMESLSRTCLAG